MKIFVSPRPVNEARIKELLINYEIEYVDDEWLKMQPPEPNHRVFDFLRDYHIPEYLAIDLIQHNGYVYDGQALLWQWIEDEKEKHRPKFRFCLEGQRAIPRRRFWGREAENINMNPFLAREVRKPLCAA